MYFYRGNMSMRKTKIGFDLDGVVIGKPFFVPDIVMEKLVRMKVDHKLAYRYPESKGERYVRFISHHPLLRPPIRKNIKLIKELHKSNKYELFVVSSRYSFLDERTKEWFRFYKMRKFFKDIHINMKNEQPHIYKERMIKKLKLKVFIDDDKPLLNYLKKRIKKVDFVYVSDQHKHFSKK